MSLKWKLSLVLGVFAALAAIAAGIIGYNSTRSQLYDQVNSSLDRLTSTILRAAAARASDEGERAPKEVRIVNNTDSEGGVLFSVQRISTSGRVLDAGNPPLPVENKDKEIAKELEPGPSRVRDIKVDGRPLRLATTPLSGGGALQVARSTVDAQETLDGLRNRYALLTLVVIFVAGVLGFFLSKTVTRPIEKLTHSAEIVTETGSPDQKIDVDGKDEVGRLARVFSRMLGTLSEAQHKEEMLVQDAGHELRTPLTSIKTNIALLGRWDEMSEKDRSSILSDLESETNEMSGLVNELVALTTIGEDESYQEVDLVSLAKGCAERASKRYARKVVVEGDSVVIMGKPSALKRAMRNLLENANKFDDSKKKIKIVVKDGSFEVRDRGRGIPDGEDRAIFERFHRATESQQTNGSGLGLSMVERVAELHGGKGFARNRPGGGAGVGFTFSAQTRN